MKSKVRDHLRNVKIDDESKQKLEYIQQTYDMSDDDCSLIDSVIANAVYDIKELDKYPTWIIDHYRSEFLKLSDNLVENVYYANSIYISDKHPSEEHCQRREFLNLAIANCKQISNLINVVRRVFPVDANKYIRYLNRLEKEIALLKGVKSADNKTLNKLTKDESTKDNTEQK